MDGVLVAVGAKLFQLHTTSRVTTVLLGGVARNPIGALVGISTALGTFECYYETDAFCHDCWKNEELCVNAVFNCAIESENMNLDFVSYLDRTITFVTWRKYSFQAESANGTGQVAHNSRRLCRQWTAMACAAT